MKMATFYERAASVVECFEGGVVVFERGHHDTIFYARDPTDSVNMDRPRMMTCDEHMGIEPQ